MQSALEEVVVDLTASYLGLNVLNGTESTSWPMCLVSYVGVYVLQNIADCSRLKSGLLFLAWSQLTPHVSNQIMALGYAPLPFGFQTFVLPL